MEPRRTVRGRAVVAVVGPFVWMAVFLPWVDPGNLTSVCLLIGGSFCLNLGIVSLCVPWLERRN
jgi:hypothetical protein